jgi:hypothetical protein
MPPLNSHPTTHFIVDVTNYVRPDLQPTKQYESSASHQKKK